MRSPKTALLWAYIFAVSLLAAVLLTGRAGHAATLVPAGTLQVPSQRYADYQASGDPSFRKHVVPLLARQGCSARECHGSFQGRGGFQLSLFGSEWDTDFVQLTQKKGNEDELHINAADPKQSLILLKPTLQMKHKGKERFKKDSWQYNLILKWIADGARNDAGKTGELDHLEVTPSELVFAKAGQAVQLRVLAHWVDGSVEDVTELTRFKTNDETVASVAETGLVTSTGKGDTHIVASYDNGVLPIPAMLAVSELAGEKFPVVATRTRIDELVLRKLKKVGVVPSELCTDAEFLRRVSLDLTGTLPTPDDVTAFIANSSESKRAEKIEQLLKSPGYAAWWTTKFCDYTGNSPRQLNIGNNVIRNPGEVSRQWYQWLYKRVADNMPYDKMVADIVLATSRTTADQTYKDYSLEMDSYFRTEHPADYANHPTLAYFWQRRNAQSPDEKALAFSHAFLGVRLECAQCHKHPFDRWTKTDFKQFTAFFGPINANQQPPKPGEDLTYQSLTRELREKIIAKIEADSGTKGADESMSDRKSKKQSKDSAEAKQDSAAAKPGAALAKADSKGSSKQADDARLNVKQRQLIQKELIEEVRRRIDANEPVPWPEVWVNSRNLPVRSKGGGGRFDPSITPKVLGGEVVSLASYADPRQPLVDWLRSKSNPYFAKAIVNRVWANYFNRGIVDPPDDMNLANAPSNGDLLNYLADGFVAHGYDMKWLHREILSSDTYQRSWKTNATNHLDSRNFSHAVVRQLPAEVMLDAIDMAIAPADKLATFAVNIDDRMIGPSGAAQYNRPGKAQRNGGNVDNYFLNLFGKPARDTNCDCERSADPTLLQTLFTRNDAQLLGRIEGQGKGSSWIADLRRTGGKTIDVDDAIRQVFLRTVSRPPTEEEISEARADIGSAKAPVDGVRDLLWAMINTREFKVNH